MKKQLVILCVIGFVLGLAALFVICFLFNRASDGTVHFFSDSLLKSTGSPAAALLLSLLVCGLYGAACMGGTMFYEIESCPLALATAAHYAVVALGYLLPVLLLRWEMTPCVLLMIEGIMTLGFFLIWLVMYLRYKAQVRELNELMQKRDGPET